MSSSSSLSDFSPRIRGRRYPHTSLLNRNTYNRMWLKKTFKEELAIFYSRQAEGFPFVPFYLRNTVYSNLLEQQHAIYLEHCDPRKMNKRSARESTLKKTTLNSDIEVTSMAPTTLEVESLNATLSKDSIKVSLALLDLRLPTCWDIKAKGEHIDISPDRLQLTYTGNGKDDPDVSSTRANHAMRRQCGIYYFEIQVISKGIDGHIGIGFCRRINSLDRFPGWEEHSWGYHGENGNVFSGPGTGKCFGPKYGTGDIIGCGIDFRDMSAFYTKNGIYLGTAFQKIKDTELYPFVGFKTPGEKIEANFGAKPFKFDIQQFLANEKQALLSSITFKPTTTQKFDTISNFEVKSIADNVVMEYLNHNGYDNAAKSLKKALLLKHGKSAEDEQLDIESLHRQEIRQALLDGDIDKVFRCCSEYYPGMLGSNPLLYFRLKCRKFMEMVKRVQSKNENPELIQDRYEAEELKIADSIDSIPAKRDASKLTPDNYKKKKPKMDKEADLSDFSSVMEYGNQLKDQYDEEAKINKTVRSELLAAFSTLAYTDLNDPAISYLFQKPHIEQVASELNSAILVSLGKYPNSSLERIYRQTSEIFELLVLTGNAKAALLQPEQDCFDPLNA